MTIVNLLKDTIYDQYILMEILNVFKVVHKVILNDPYVYHYSNVKTF